MENCKSRACALALAFAAPGAFAETDASASVLPQGWYVTPMLTHMKPDSARCHVNGGFGGAVALGHRAGWAALEIWGQSLSLSHDACTYLVPGPTTPDPADDERVPFTEPAGEVSLDGGGLVLMVGPFSEDAFLSRLFGIVGFGLLQRQGQPRYEDGSTAFGEAGAGYAQPFRLFGREVAARFEVRYRFDVQQPPYPTTAEQNPPPEHLFQDLIVNLGLQVPLSAPPETAAASEPVAVVPAASGDSDNDGVNDDRDQCPDTPAGSYVSNAGCAAALWAPAETAIPDSAPVLETARAGDTVVLKGVTFESGKAKLRPDSETVLDGVAEALQKRAELKVEVGGHTDDRGADAYNLSLSQQRADAVLGYLAGHGVDASRLTAVGYGEAQPVEGNDTSEGRERNRRVELKVLQ